MDTRRISEDAVRGASRPSPALVLTTWLVCWVGGGVAGCVATSAGPERRGDPAIDDAERDAVIEAFVSAHNDVRASALPPPSPALGDLAWDDALARVAQTWSERCIFEHSAGPHGENLAYVGGDRSTPTDVVTLWASEAADYDYAANACRGEQCGHYTQIVWRSTGRVGCGASTCDMFGGRGVFWVCNYDPPGNFIGQRPY